MATTNKQEKCGACKSVLSDGICPKCEDGGDLALPYFTSCQIRKLKKTAMRRSESGKEEMNEKYLKQVNNLFKGMDDQDRIDCLTDAGHVLETLIHTNSKELKTIIALGKSIGERANALEAYVKAFKSQTLDKQ